MGWFDALFGSKKKALDPDEVRKLLFDAVAAGDDDALAEGCAAHEAVVLASFTEWKVVPEEYRTPDKIGWYGPGLIAVARHFAAVRGHPELFEALTGSPRDNVITQWQEELAQADELIEACRYREAADALRALAGRMQEKGIIGPGKDHYLAMTWGRLAGCFFQSGDADGAVAPAEQALAICEAQGDHEGIVAYLGNLYEIHRYRGAAEAAARSSEILASAVERAGDARQASIRRRQAAVVRAGEPLCRVLVDVGGELTEVTDLPSLPKDRVRFVFSRNRITLRPSAVAVAEGERAGQAGDFVAALSHFRRAAEADRFDPEPRYQEGVTLSYLRRYHESVVAYDATEALAPGWYHCRADRWLAEQLASGAVDHGLFLVVRELFDGGLPPARAVELAREGLTKARIALLHLALGDALVRLDRATDAAEAYREGLTIAEERDARTRLLTALGAIVADPGEKARLLTGAVELQGNLVAAAMAAVVLRSEPNPD